MIDVWLGPSATYGSAWTSGPAFAFFLQSLPLVQPPQGGQPQPPLHPWSSLTPHGRCCAHGPSLDLVPPPQYISAQCSPQECLRKNRNWARTRVLVRESGASPGSEPLALQQTQNYQVTGEETVPIAQHSLRGLSAQGQHQARAQESSPCHPLGWQSSEGLSHASKSERCQGALRQRRAGGDSGSLKENGKPARPEGGKTGKRPVI